MLAVIVDLFAGVGGTVLDDIVVTAKASGCGACGDLLLGP